MQIKGLVFGLMASAVVAQSAKNPVADTLTTIGGALEKLGKNINSWSGDVVEASNILTQAQDLLGVIETSTGAVKASAVMPLTDAVNILKPANNVVKLVQGVVDSLIAKKPGFDAAKLSSVVKDVVVKIKSSAATLISDVQAKLPDNVKAVADSIGKQINTAIDKGIAAYS
jgi:Hydrophobic surface binding protein A